jgi:hypothetical protein
LTKIHKNCAEKRRIPGNWNLAVSLCAVLTACKPAADPVESTVAEVTSVLLCGDDGYLNGELYGAVRARFDLDSAGVACEGMPRPEGVGARLRFAGKAQPGDRQIAIIIALPEFSIEATDVELPANVTLIEEGNGAFYSTPDLDNCLGEISSVTPIRDSDRRFAVTGGLYCVSPLPEVNGDSSVSIPELRFSGLLDWTVP